MRSLIIASAKLIHSTLLLHRITPVRRFNNRSGALFRSSTSRRSCYRRKRRRMPNTGVRAMRCASYCSASRTWIVCWVRMSAARKRNRSMTGNNGHAPKRFAETRSRASCAFKGVLGALPLTSRGEFSRRRKFPENVKEGPLCPAYHVFSRPSQRCNFSHFAGCLVFLRIFVYNVLC